MLEKVFTVNKSTLEVHLFRYTKDLLDMKNGNIVWDVRKILQSKILVLKELNTID